MQPRASIFVLGDYPEAKIVEDTLRNEGGSLIELGAFLGDHRNAYGLFFCKGPFYRASEDGMSPERGFVRFRVNEEGLKDVGIDEVPSVLRGARGFIACRHLSVEELRSADTVARFRNAVREAERLCTQRWRHALQPKRGRRRFPPTQAETATQATA